MAIDTRKKRAASIYYGRFGGAEPSASSTEFKRGTALGLYPIVAAAEAVSRVYNIMKSVVIKFAS